MMTAGLVAREIERRGIPTVVLNSIWSFQRRVGMPRVAAIEFPMGRALGDVGEAKLHREILLASLELFETAREPGWVEHLPYRWPHPPEETVWLPDPPPPYLLLIRKGWRDRVARAKQRDAARSGRPDATAS